MVTVLDVESMCFRIPRATGSKDMKDDYYRPPYVYYALNVAPTILEGTEWTFFTEDGRVKVRVVGKQTVPAWRRWKQFAKVLVEVIDRSYNDLEI
jgi:hypothetical protein